MSKLTCIRNSVRILDVEKKEDPNVRLVTSENTVFRLHPTKGWRKDGHKQREISVVNVHNLPQKPFKNLVIHEYTYK